MAAPEAEHFLQRSLLAEQLTEHLRARIVAGKIEPGQRLLEQDLAREFGISRAPLREAIRMLATEGLVTLVPYRGARVSDITKDEARQLYPVRAALEAAAARVAARRVCREGAAALAGELAIIDAALQGMEDGGRAADVIQFFRNAAMFHDQIVALSGNPLLLRNYEILSAQTRRHQAFMSRVSHSLEASLKEHRAIVAAVKAGDEDRASRLAEAHVLRIERDFEVQERVREGESARENCEGTGEEEAP
jgi:DNA-binding GntR family transcriptional regulator